MAKSRDYDNSGSNNRKNKMSEAYLDSASLPDLKISDKYNFYKNALTYPSGFDHFKYFDNIPHPERVPPALLGILENSPKPDLNISHAQRLMEFTSIKNYRECHFRNALAQFLLFFCA